MPADMTREANFTDRTEQFGPYTVEVTVSKYDTVAITTGIGGRTRDEPRMRADIRRGRRVIGSYQLNACTMGSVRGTAATCAEILHAVFGDEDIFTGDATRPEDQAALAEQAVETSGDPSSTPTEIPDVPGDEVRFGWSRDSNIWPNNVASTGTFGDDAVGTAFDSRYTKRLSDGTYLVCTVAFYVENIRDYDTAETDPDYAVRCQIEYLHCTDLGDPGGTEISSEYRHLDIGLPYGHGLHYYEHECLRLVLADQRSEDMNSDVEAVLGL